MRTSILADVIALIGLIAMVVGAWSVFALIAEQTVEVPLTDYIIAFGMISGGLAMGGLAQGLRLLLVILRGRQQVLNRCAKQLPEPPSTSTSHRSETDALALGSKASQPFSLRRLEQENPGLARYFLWDSNPVFTESSELWLHLGCGVRVFEGFANLDFCPQDARVLRWNLLDLWPEELDDKVEGVFSEDCVEHFFHAEQTYILCNINRALRPKRVARILMPSLAKLVDQYPTYRAGPHDYLHNTWGIETGGDAVNCAMRLTGHRWLHDPQSLAHMSELCGFHATPTECASSSVAKFNGLNLRDESSGSLSFANDLRKTRCISRVMISPALVKGATKVEDLTANGALFVATSKRPVIEYLLPHRIASGSVVCMNFRSSNLSSFEGPRTWDLKTLVIDEINCAKPWVFDETLKSQPCMNLITKSQLKVALGGDRDFSRLNFSPAYNIGEYFTLGCVEVFVSQ